MKLQHTPGPWGYKRSATGYEYIIGKGDTFRFGFCAIHGGNDEAEANARLIAAAPEMLEIIINGYIQSEKASIMVKNDFPSLYDKYMADMDRLGQIIERATGLSIEEVLQS